METKQKPFDEVIADLEREIRSWQITVENKDKEIEQLKAELEAVGAGGVQPLRAAPGDELVVRIRYGVLHEFAASHNINYDDLRRVARAALCDSHKSYAAVGEREAYINWMHDTYPHVYSKAHAEQHWDYEYDTALAWQARAALATSPAVVNQSLTAATEVQAEPVAWLVYLPSEESQRVYDDQDDPGYVDDVTNNPDAVVSPLYTSPVAAQGEQLDTKRWMAFNIGCIECGVSSAIIGLYDTKEEAESVCTACAAELDWREGGQNDFVVFDLHAPQAEEYRFAIDAALSATTPPQQKESP